MTSNPSLRLSHWSEVTPLASDRARLRMPVQCHRLLGLFSAYLLWGPHSKRLQMKGLRLLLAKNYLLIFLSPKREIIIFLKWWGLEHCPVSISLRKGRWERLWAGAGCQFSSVKSQSKTKLASNLVYKLIVRELSFCVVYPVIEMSNNSNYWFHYLLIPLVQQ